MKIVTNLNSISQPIEYLQVILQNKTECDSLIKFKEKYPAVYKTLLHEFGEVENIKYTAEEKVLYLSFYNNGQKVAAVYSINGHKRYSVTNIGTTLPKMISDKLKTEYPTYSVFYGKDIRKNNETIYQVIIENNIEYRVINLRDEEIQEIKQIKKSI